MAPWACSACTYENPELYLACGMCATPRTNVKAAEASRNAPSQPAAQPRAANPSPQASPKPITPVVAPVASAVSPQKSPVPVAQKSPAPAPQNLQKSPAPAPSPIPQKSPSSAVAAKPAGGTPTSWKEWRQVFDALNGSSSLEALREGLQQLDKAYAEETGRLRQARNRSVLDAINLDVEAPQGHVNYAKKTMRR